MNSTFRFSRRASLFAILGAAAASLAASAVVSLTVHWPEPYVHDEFSQLLAADTFANGRIAAPAPPFPEHFESFHLFVEPTYASKYPPAPPAFMALGQVLTGEPIVGVWIAGALMCASLMWLCLTVLPGKAGLLTGALATLQLGATTYWTQSFWGGAVACAGGALTFASAYRLSDPIPELHRTRDAAILGAGLVLMALSRPLEGLFLAGAAVAYVGSERRHAGVSILSGAGPTIAAGIAGLAIMAGHNAASTGTWAGFPYLHHEAEYAQRAVLQSPDAREPLAYNHRELCRFHGITEEKLCRATLEKDESETPIVRYREYRDPDHVRPSVLERFAYRLFTFFAEIDGLRVFVLGRALLLPFLLGLAVGVGGASKLARYGMIAAFAVMAISRYFHPHYLAPAVGAMFVLVGLGLERIAQWKFRGMSVGPAVVAAIALATALGAVRELDHSRVQRSRGGIDHFLSERARVIAELETSPGLDLVFVQYGQYANVNRDWVYNGADWESAGILWARDMGAQRNARVAAYFDERVAWVARVESETSRVTLERFAGR